MCKFVLTRTLAVGLAAIWNTWLFEGDCLRRKTTKFLMIAHWLIGSMSWMCYWETTQLTKLLASGAGDVKKEMSTLPKLFLKTDIQWYKLLLLSVFTVLLITCCNSIQSSQCKTNAQLISRLSLMHWKMLCITRNQAYPLKVLYEITLRILG